MELAKRISIIVGAIMAVAAIAGAFIQYGKDKENINSRTFESPAQMVKTVTYVEDSPSPAEIQRDRILDSIKDAAIIASAYLRDSLLLEERKSRIITDSINKLNADQFYQSKKIQDKILQELEIIKRQQ
jgi:hypothetical protein